MTVLAIRLENFMAFADSGWIELKPVTLLFGRNSSGKSVIIRALRLLRQSLDHPSYEPPLLFFSEHGLNQGDFVSTVNQRVVPEDDPEEKVPERRRLTFHFRCRVPGVADEVRELINRQRQQRHKPRISAEEGLTHVDLSMSFGRSYDFDEHAWGVELVGVQVTCPWPMLDTEQNIVFMAERQLEVTSEELWSWSTDWAVYSDFLQGHTSQTNEISWADVFIVPANGFLPGLDIPVPLRRHPSTPVFEDIEFIERILKELEGTISVFLRSMHHLGPIRPAEERTYSFKRDEMEAWRGQGWGAFLDFLSVSKTNDDLRKQVGHWLRTLDLATHVRVTSNQLGDEALVSRVELVETDEDYHSGVLRNIRDVGSGVGQVLPVLVSTLLAETSSFIAVEQPELHLHPRAQARLGDLFIQRVYETSSKERRLLPARFCLETHSEHLLLRLQRRIREKVLQLDDITVLYVVRGDGQSLIYPLRLDEDGDFIDEWPEGFFVEGYMDMFGLDENDNEDASLLSAI